MSLQEVSHPADNLHRVTCPKRPQRRLKAPVKGVSQQILTEDLILASAWTFGAETRVRLNIRGSSNCPPTDRLGHLRDFAASNSFRLSAPRLPKVCFFFKAVSLCSARES